MSLILRSAKGSPLTHGELDGNQIHLNSKLPTWSSTYTYAAGMFCTYSNQIWRALATNTNRQPNTSPGDWVAYFAAHSHTNIGDISTLVSTDITFSANSDSLLPTQRAVKTYVDAAISGGGYTDEQAQDAVVNILSTGETASDLSVVYNDVGNSLAFAIKNSAVGTGKIADTAVTTSKLADGAVTLGKISFSYAQANVGAVIGCEGLSPVSSVLVSNNGAVLISGLEIRKIPAISGPTFLKLLDMTGPGIMGTQTTGVPGRIALGANFAISSNTLNLTTTGTSRLLGRFDAGAGTVQEITLGSGLDLSAGGILSAPGGSGYTFTASPRLYGRSTAGAGVGQEITIGAGLTLTGGELAATGGGGGGAAVTISDTAPSTPSPTDLWWSSTDLSLRIYYDDGTTAQWVDASPVGSGYTFTNTTKLYGRSTAGSGPGEEITIGSGLTLSGGTLSASGGGGGGGAQPGILGYETVPTGLYRASIAGSNNTDPNQALSNFSNTAFIANLGLVPDSASNNVGFGLIAASSDIQSPIAGSLISMIGTSTSRISVADTSVILAAQLAVIHNPPDGMAYTGLNPICSLVHGSYVAGSTSSRTFNYGPTDGVTYITSFDIDNSYTPGPDSAAIIESTLISKHNGFLGSRFMTNTGGMLHDLLKGSSTTLAPFFFNIFITVLAVSEDGVRSAAWEIKALVQGTGVNSCSIVGSSVTQIFATTPALAVGTVPSLSTSAFTDPYDIPSGTLSLRGNGESGSFTTFYAYVRIQKLIRTAA